MGRIKITAGEGGLPAVLDDQDLFGESVARTGDLDGDGIADLAVGAEGDDDGAAGAGAVWLLFMNQDGTVKSTTAKYSRTSAQAIPGLSSSDGFGNSLAWLGDLDGPGGSLGALAVGNAGHDDSPTGNNNGEVYILFLGPGGALLNQQRISNQNGGFSGGLGVLDEFGGSLAYLGDLDGPGGRGPALAVGAGQDNSGGAHRGAVYLLYLNPNGTVQSDQKISSSTHDFGGMLRNNDFFGGALASLGDLDGATDSTTVCVLAVGASGDDDGELSNLSYGAMWLLYLRADGTIARHLKIARSEGGHSVPLLAGDRFGSAIAPCGDLEGDGVSDLAVGAREDGSGTIRPGSVWLLLVRPDGSIRPVHRIDRQLPGLDCGLEDGDAFGISLANLGDLDGDGSTDLAVGAFRDNDGGGDPSAARGAVWILSHGLMTPYGISGTGPSAPAREFVGATPNPARGKTRLTYSSGQPGRVELVICDITGRLVRRLLDVPTQGEAGEVIWDGRDDAGQRVNAGVYLAKLAHPGGSVATKVLRLN